MALSHVEGKVLNAVVCKKPMILEMILVFYAPLAFGCIVFCVAVLLVVGGLISKDQS